MRKRLGLYKQERREECNVLPLQTVPVWLLLATAHLLVKIVVEIYCIGKGIVNLILGFMLIGTLLWYRQWERFALLAVASGILLFFLWIGVFMEVILESAQHKIGKWIIK